MEGMRWLLIILVLLLQVQAPAMAEAAPVAAAASCHDMAGMNHDRQDDGAKLHQGKAHLCPGCSIPGTTPLVDPRAQTAPCAPVATPLTALDSRAQPPSLPPPRLA